MRIFWERYGDGEPAVLLLPTWTIIHSRFWKMQIPDLARRTRVITFDGRGNGRTDRPRESVCLCGHRVRGRCPRGPRRDRDRPRGRRRVVDGRCVRAAPRRRSRGSGARCRVHRSVAPDGGHVARSRASRLRRGVGQRRGLGDVQQARLAARLAQICRVLHGRGVHGAAFDQADRRHRRLGGGDGRRDDGDGRGRPVAPGP